MLKNQNPNTYTKYISLATQLAVSVIGMALLGDYLDQNNKTPVYTIIFTFFGIFVGLYLVIKTVKS